MRSLQRGWITYGVLAAIVVSGFFLRGWGIRWGLPQAERFTTLYVDEYTPFWILHRMDPRHGDFNPHYSNNPTFFYYQLGAALAVAAKAHLISLTADKSSYLMHPDQYAKLYLTGRALCVLYGLGTIVLFFFLGRRISGSMAGGWLCAALYAAVPVSVVQCHVIDTSVPACFWMTASLLCLLRSLEAEDRKWLLYGALAAGLSISTKYTCAPFVPLVLFAAWRRHRLWTDGVPALALVGAGFFVGTPYILLDAKHMLPGVIDMFQSASGVTLSPSIRYVLYPFAHFGYVVGLPLCLFAIAGLILHLRRKDAFAQMSLLFLIPYFGLLGRSNLHVARYINETLPFVLPFAAAAIISISNRPAWKGITLFAAVLCFSRLPYTLAIDRSLSTEADPRDQASAWIVQTIPASSRIGLEHEANFIMPAHLYMDYWKGVRYPTGTVAPPAYVYSLWDNRAKQWRPAIPDYWIETNFYFKEVSKTPAIRAEQASNNELMPQGYRTIAAFKRTLRFGPFHYEKPALPGNDWILFLPEITIHERH